MEFELTTRYCHCRAMLSWCYNICKKSSYFFSVSYIFVVFKTEKIGLLLKCTCRMQLRCSTMQTAAQRMTWIFWNRVKTFIQDNSVQKKFSETLCQYSPNVSILSPSNSPWKLWLQYLKDSWSPDDPVIVWDNQRHHSPKADVDVIHKKTVATNTRWKLSVLLEM